MGKSYFSSFTPDRYYDTSYLQLYIEGKIGKSIEEIEDDIRNAHIYVSEDRIKAYLNQLFIKNDEELFWKILNNESEAKELYFDRMDSEQYTYDPAQTNYYNDYLSVLRTKLITMLEIIKGITVRNHEGIEEYLKELDIKLSKRNKELKKKGKEDYLAGRILGSDVLRLVKPFIFLYKDLMQMTEEANDLESYYLWDRSDHIKVGKTAPESILQASDEYSERYGEYIQGFIPYTKKQKAKQKRLKNKATNEVIKTIKDLR